MAKTEAKLCPHCGAKMVEYPHTLSKGIVRALVKAFKYRNPMNEFSIADCNLSYSERENIRKLQYWNVIAKLNNEKEKGGDWKITHVGIRFLMGKMPLRHKVWTYRGAVQRFEGDDKFITDITGGWKYRPDYAREAVAHQ